MQLPNVSSLHLRGRQRQADRHTDRDGQREREIARERKRHRGREIERKSPAVSCLMQDLLAFCRL